MAQQAPVSPQQPLPQEAYQYAEMYHLGTPVAAHRVLYRNSITMGIICVLLGALFVAVFVSDGTNILLLLLALLCAGGVVYYLALYPLLYGSWRLYTCTEGFVLLKGNQATPCRWDQIAFVWQRIVAYYRYGIRTGTSYKYTIQRADGAQIVLTQMFRGVSELGLRVQREVTSRQAPQALAAVNAGQTLPFGRFSLSQQGLGTPKGTLPWSDVQQVSASGGWLMVQQRGQRRGTSYGRVNALPNLYVFLSVSDALIQGQGR